ncbi:hypothetical protein [Rhodopirellula europaea]|uniref:hypothetical protein n=1 Tax=Rhodopirellula europaea TaxID=1263866 RepID=UPI00130EDF79|nr:hypothetical protein [Rhodopirellula europaea]
MSRDSFYLDVRDEKSAAGGERPAAVLAETRQSDHHVAVFTHCVWVAHRVLLRVSI